MQREHRFYEVIKERRCTVTYQVQLKGSTFNYESSAFLFSNYYVALFICSISHRRILSHKETIIENRTIAESEGDGIVRIAKDEDGRQQKKMSM